MQLFRILFPFMKARAFELIITVCILPLSSLAFSVQPVIIQRAIDGPLANGDLNELDKYVWFFIASVALCFCLQLYQFWLVNITGQKIVSSIRNKLFFHLQSLPMRFFDRTPVGVSVSRLTSDMEQLSESFAGGLVLIIVDVFNILGILAFMFYLSVPLSLAVLIFFVPIFFVTLHYQNIFRKANLEARKILAELNSQLQQSVVGILVIQVLNSAKKVMNDFGEKNKKYFAANDQGIKADAQLSASTEFISIFAIVTVILLAAYIWTSEASGKETLFAATNFLGTTMSLGILLAFIQYTQSLFEPVRNLSDRFTIIQSAFTAAQRIEQLLSEEVQFEPEKQKYKFALKNNEEPLISFNKVSFKYNTEEAKQVLNALSFDVFPKEKIAIIGKTGSGKSTIIKLLTKLYTRYEGQIKLAGKNIKDINAMDLRSLVTVIPQDSYIFAGNLKENISLNRKEESLNWDLVQPILLQSKLKLDQELSQRGENISAGEEQIINFARALITDPDIVILDEATSKIDEETEKAIQATLDKFFERPAKVFPKTLIMIAHRESTISSAGRVLNLT